MPVRDRASLPSTAVRHLVWDWNGTLLDDLDLVVTSVNHALGSIGAAPIDAATYRQHYTRPVHRFYEALLGRVVDAGEMRVLDDRFHDAYVAGSPPLAPDARDALDVAERRGATQSIASMLWHDRLVTAVLDAGIGDRMVAVDGHRGSVGETKAAHLGHHVAGLKTLHGLEGTVMVLIGDITDDADAARDVGIDCVLYDGGSQPRAALEATGRAVAGSLLEAVEIALA